MDNVAISGKFEEADVDQHRSKHPGRLFASESNQLTMRDATVRELLADPRPREGQSTDGRKTR